jgi:hypothetical protein
MYFVKIATAGFYCPISRERVRQGDAYIEDEEGNHFHLNQLPARRLTPLKDRLNANKTGKQELVSR